MQDWGGAGRVEFKDVTSERECYTFSFLEYKRVMI